MRIPTQLRQRRSLMMTCGLLGVCLLTFLGWLWLYPMAVTPDSISRTMPSQPSLPGMQSMPANHATDSATNGPFAHWRTWPPHKLHDIVASYIGRRSVSDDILDMMFTLFHEKNIDPATRNNAVNILADQSEDIRQITDQLLVMFLDPGESTLWKSYTLQFLADRYQQANDADRKRIIDALHTGLNHPEGVIVGTSLLQFTLLQRSTLYPAQDDHIFIDALHNILTNPNDDIEEISSALIVAGEIQLTSSATAIRYLISNNSNPTILRTGIAALGCLGNRQDIAQLLPYRNHAHPLVVAAAQQAIARLNN